MNSIMVALYNSFIGAADNLRDFNDSLIWVLSLLEFVTACIYAIWVAPQTALKKVFTVVLVITFFNFVLATSPATINMLFNGTLELAVKASDMSLSPTDIFNKGFSLVSKLTSLGVGGGVSNMITNGLFWFLTVLVTLFVFLILAADFFIAYVRFYVYAVMSGTMIALAIFKPTREIFYNFLKGMLGLLFYLFVFTMFLSVLSDQTKNWEQRINDVTINQPFYGEGKYAQIGTWGCANLGTAFDIGYTKQQQDLCSEYQNDLRKYKERVNTFYGEEGIKMMVTLLLIFIVIKNVVPWFASIVGFGNYGSEDGMGVVGQIANIASRGMNNAGVRSLGDATKAIKNRFSDSSIGTGLKGFGKGIASGDPIKGAKDALAVKKANKVMDAERVKKAYSTIKNNGK